MGNNYKKIYKTNAVPIEFHEIEYTVSDKGLFPYIHWHDSIEILFFKDGIAHNLIDDNIIEEKANDVLVINGGTLHSTQAVTDNLKYCCIIIDKNLCEQYGFCLSDYYVKPKVNDIRLFSIINEIQNEFMLKKDHFDASITAKVLEMLTILFREYAEQKQSKNFNKNIEMIKKGIDFIKNNYKDNITVDDIAKSAGYSKYYFCRSFKTITKYTVNSYINRLRIDFAYELISKKGYSVGEAAVECGFDDISYFTKVFKKHKYMLPSDVKKK